MRRWEQRIKGAEEVGAEDQRRWEQRIKAEDPPPWRSLAFELNYFLKLRPIWEMQAEISGGINLNLTSSMTTATTWSRYSFVLLEGLQTDFNIFTSHFPFIYMLSHLQSTLIKLPFTFGIYTITTDTMA